MFLPKILLQLFLKMDLSNWTGPSRKQKCAFRNKDLVVQYVFHENNLLCKYD